MQVVIFYSSSKSYSQGLLKRTASTKKQGPTSVFICVGSSRVFWLWHRLVFFFFLSIPFFFAIVSFILALLLWVFCFSWLWCLVCLDLVWLSCVAVSSAFWGFFLSTSLKVSLIVAQKPSKKLQRAPISSLCCVLSHILFLSFDFRVDSNITTWQCEVAKKEGEKKELKKKRRNNKKEKL